MNRIKSTLRLLFGLGVVLVAFILLASRAEEKNISKTIETNLTISKENPLLKQLNIKAVEPDPNAKANFENKIIKKTLEKSDLKIQILKGENKNTEFDARLEMEAYEDDNSIRRLFVEVIPHKKELTAEETFKMQNQIVLDKIIIEQTVTGSEFKENAITITAPAKVFYSEGEQKKRIISNAEFIYKKDSALATLIINPEIDKAIEAENKIIFEKDSAVGAKLIFKTNFKVAIAVNNPEEVKPEITNSEVEITSSVVTPQATASATPEITPVVTTPTVKVKSAVASPDEIRPAADTTGKVKSAVPSPEEIKSAAPAPE